MTNDQKSAIKTFAPRFSDLVILNGGKLPDRPACHALWYYFVTARRNWEKQGNPIVLEGDADPEYNYKQLYTSVAFWFGVSPEEMNKYWSAVDDQCLVLGLPILPHSLRFTGIHVN